MANKKAKTSNTNIAENWEALSGQSDWKGLLDPLDIDLRRYVIHYGERANAIADAFISETKSKNCGLTYFPPETLFSDVGLEKNNPFGYRVTKYIYAAYGPEASKKVFFKSEVADAPAGDSNIVGYVAVATDAGKVALGRRDILVVWRGSMLSGDWIADFTYDLVPGTDIIGTTHNPKLHKGWYTLYTATNSSPFNKTSARDQVFAEVKSLVAQYQAEEISITVAGHSMGAGMATLNAVDMAFNKLNTLPSDKTNKPFALTAFVYACPRVGDHGFGNVFSDLHATGGLRLLRINEFLDTVPHLPPLLFGYVDVGQLLLLNILQSPYIKPFLHLFHNSKFLPVHNLELHLHDVAGTKGVVGDFELVIDRDLSLINKKGDFVKDEYGVVIDWWTEKNKSMTQTDDGQWVLEDSWSQDAK